MDEEIKKIAKTLVWWKQPEEVEFNYLLRRVMEMGTPDMLAWVWHHYGEKPLREALATAEPGNFSDRSWNYWHVIFGLRPTPPLPQRIVPDSPYVSSEIRRASTRAAGPLAAIG